MTAAEVDLLFDDGVEYTAPVVHVRKRVSPTPHFCYQPVTNLFISCQTRLSTRQRTATTSSPPWRRPSWGGGSVQIRGRGRTIPPCPNVTLPPPPSAHRCPRLRRRCIDWMTLTLLKRRARIWTILEKLAKQFSVPPNVKSVPLSVKSLGSPEVKSLPPNVNQWRWRVQRWAETSYTLCRGRRRWSLVPNHTHVKLRFCKELVGLNPMPDHAQWKTFRPCS